MVHLQVAEDQLLLKSRHMMLMLDVAALRSKHSKRLNIVVLFATLKVHWYA